MSDNQTAKAVTAAVNGWMDARDSLVRQKQLTYNHAFGSVSGSQNSAQEFVETMDGFTRRLMSEFPEFSPDQWQAFAEIARNVEKFR